MVRAVKWIILCILACVLFSGCWNGNSQTCPTSYEHEWILESQDGYATLYYTWIGLIEYNYNVYYRAVEYDYGPYIKSLRTAAEKIRETSYPLSSRLYKIDNLNKHLAFYVGKLADRIEAGYSWSYSRFVYETGWIVWEIKIELDTICKDSS